jgi:serine/threonine protein kinase
MNLDKLSGSEVSTSSAIFKKEMASQDILSKIDKAIGFDLIDISKLFIKPSHSVRFVGSHGYLNLEKIKDSKSGKIKLILDYDIAENKISIAVKKSLKRLPENEHRYANEQQVSSLILENKFEKHLVKVSNLFVTKTSPKSDNPSFEKLNIILEKNDEDLSTCLFIKKQNLSTFERINIALQVIGDLMALHDNGIYHGDIAHGNILLKKAQEAISACLCDFGFSARPEQKRKRGYTPEYAPPEAWDNMPRPKDYDFNKDKWSLGVVLLTLFSKAQTWHRDIAPRKAYVKVINLSIDKQAAKMQLALKAYSLDRDPEKFVLLPGLRDFRDQQIPDEASLKIRRKIRETLLVYEPEKRGDLKVLYQEISDILKTII